MKIYKIEDSFYRIDKAKHSCYDCCFYIRHRASCRLQGSCRASTKEHYKEIKGHRNILNILCGLRIIKHIKD